MHRWRTSKFGENVSNTLQDIVLTIFWDDTRMNTRTDEQDKNTMPPATLCWTEAQKQLCVSEVTTAFSALMLMDEWLSAPQI